MERPRRLLLTALLLGVPVAAAVAAGWAASRAEADLKESAAAQLALYNANLRAELERHAAVPLALAQDAEVKSLLSSPSPERVEHMNRKLEDIARALDALALYVMDSKGQTIAASNWKTATSFVGENFSYRPYFRKALDQGEGHHFALGTTSLVPGYYTAYRVLAENRTVGAVVLKIGFDRLERAWGPGQEKLLVTDRSGVAFITNMPDWRYHALPRRLPIDLPLVPEGTSEGLDVLPWAFGGASDRIALEERGGPRSYLLTSVAMPGGDWTLHSLTSLAPVTVRAWVAGLLAAALVALGALAAYAIALRRSALVERLVMQEESRMELERRVTAAKADLRAAENELTQAAKLAALGQMSAGIAHEINQPLAAMRSFADNAVVLLERGRADAVRSNLGEIAELTDRMAAITRQLKGFARRASGTLGPVSANAAVTQALLLLDSKLRREDVTVESDLPDTPVWVVGEDVRLQQVLVNLIGNAADAMRGCPVRRVRIALVVADGEALLSVADSGTGIAEAALPRLFVPFFTTKEAGEGLGLGLSISHGIVEDFGGSLTAANRNGLPGHGAVFTLRLKTTEQPA
ncbi:sensor histidine kinase [Azospirillum picis]|uniref:histidine kinase n=1 Tax=Azospirillum picis TaxID=488438 RepID=A0ABU0MGZ4_9PROT|nr:ATP-binding protein [Azospirillum picis]MBP2299054.1 two-component system C4-dicarboxylate transport sensor histidine kinase DctB [Azospirillum picis]MDQ0532704.1 two-component system C4-dicarboxylate transport sensor histidine kinase DctB [Azospirillum picis]